MNHAKREAILRDWREGYTLARSAQMRGVTEQEVRAVRLKAMSEKYQKREARNG